MNTSRASDRISVVDVPGWRAHSRRSTVLLLAGALLALGVVVAAAVPAPGGEPMEYPHRHQLIHVIRSYGLHERSAAVANILTAAESGVLSELQCIGYLQQLQPLIREQETRPNLLPEPPDEEQLFADGRFPLEFGTLQGSNLRMGLYLDPLKHFLACGQTDTGKSTLMRGLVIGLDRLAKETGRALTQVVIDPKVDYADIPGQLGDNWQHVNVLDEGFRISLAPPRGTRYVNAWIHQVAEILAARLHLIASMPCLANMLRFLVPLLNPHPTDELLFPDPSLLLEVARDVPLECFAAKPDWGKTLIGALEGLSVAGGHALCAFRGLDIQDLIGAGKSLVIQTANLKPAALRSIIMELIVAQKRFAGLEQQQKTTRTRLVLTVDEADVELSENSDRAYPDEISLLAEFLKQGREIGCTAILGVTSMEGLSHYVLANIGCYAIFNQPRPLSRALAAKTLAVPPAAEVMLRSLGRGECVVLSTPSAFPHPLLILTDNIAPNRTPKQTPYDQLAFVPSRPLRELPTVQRALARIAAQFRNARRQQKQAAEAKIADDAHALLMLIVLRPAVPIVQLAKELGKKLAPAKQEAICQQLADANYAEFEDDRVGKRNLLLAEAREAGAQRVGKEYVAIPGRGGRRHRTYAAWLMMLADKKGIRARRELVIGGHPVDVAYEEEAGRWHAFEVIADESGCKNIADHLRSCLVASDRVSRVTIVVPLLELQRQAAAVIDADLTLAPVRDRIDFLTLSSVYEELWP